MPVNKYTNSFTVKSEQNLLSDLTDETISFNGIDVIYAPRKLVAEDRLLGEDVLSAFSEAFAIEMILNTVQQFGGQGDLISKFGLDINDDVELEVSRRRFKDTVGLIKPQEGDLIYFPLSKGVFEVKFVEDETPFYQLGSLHSFKLTCELFKYSQEVMDTGVDEIDDIEVNFGNDDDPSKDPFADNALVETEAAQIIDFSESNPWGEY